MLKPVQLRAAIAALAILALAGCGGGGLFSGGGQEDSAQPAAEEQNGNFYDLFRKQDNPNTTVAVNKYIWNASLEVLNFLPIRSADPFSGVIVTGFGTPPGGGTAYRATILIQDPALDARSLNLALVTRRGPVSADTARAVENAILTRARQLRQRDLRL